MELVDLTGQSADIRAQAAGLLHRSFNHALGWPSLDSALEEVARVIQDGFARALLDGGRLLGRVGGLPEYGGRVWELPPIVVQPDQRRRGVGRVLGTDDDAGLTSLADVDLYDGLPRHIAELRDLGQEHPFLFYLKLGFVVTGVVPDANGPGRPDIYMSKRIQHG